MSLIVCASAIGRLEVAKQTRLVIALSKKKQNLLVLCVVGFWYSKLKAE